MTIRITGMNSGLDTESIINELASARSMKVQKVEKDQTKLSWKIDAWKALNAKVYSLYSDVLSDMRFDYAYSKKTTKASNPNAVSVVTSGDAVNGTQTMKVNQLAKASYLTGGAIASKAASFTGSAIKNEGIAAHIMGGKIAAETILNGNRISGATDGTKTMKELGILKDGESSQFTLTTLQGSDNISVSADMTLDDVLSELQGKGVTATFADGRFTITEATQGANGFSITKAENDTLSASLISKLGLNAAKTTTALTNGSLTTLAELGVSGSLEIRLQIGDEPEQAISLTDSDKLSDVARNLRNAGIYARFNQSEGRFILSSTDPAKTLKITDNGSSRILERLGIAAEATNEITGQTSLAALGFGTGGDDITFNLKFDGAAEATPIRLKGFRTLDDVAAELEKYGLNAQFNSKTGQFVLSAKETGKSFDISAVADDADSASFLQKLGLQYDAGKGPSAGKVEDGTTTLKDLGLGTDGKEIQFKLTIGGKAEEVTLKGSQTLDDVAKMLREKGLNAKFDAATKRFFISSKESGTANGFTIEAQRMAGRNADGTANWENSEDSLAVLQNLGLYYNPDDAASTGKMVNAQDAQVELNGVEFTFAKNTFEINGLTITAMQQTQPGEEITLTTQQDTDGIYDMIKNFVKKYNELINEMDKLYNAKSSSKYEPLTKDEKDAMSDTEVEEWEKTIKESLLRRDTTLFSVASAMKNAMSSTHLNGKAGINNGRDIYLSFFGIETLGYYKSKDNEKSAYHINGDKDDTNVRNKDETLKKAIANDPDTVIEFFKSLANNLYTALDEKMSRVEGSSSAFTVYNDIQMDNDLKKYDSKVKAEQKKLNDYVDRWYQKFSRMEVAMAKMKSKESSLSGLFGG